MRILTRHKTLFDFYKKYGYIWQPTRILLSHYKRHQVYDLREDHLVDHINWNENFDNEFKIYAKGTDKNSGYWRISGDGLLVLKEIFSVDIWPDMYDATINLLIKK